MPRRKPLLRLKRRPSPNWSKSGAPAAAPKSAARATIAAGIIAIRTSRTARALPPRARPKAARARGRNVIAAGATATAISRSRARVHRARRVPRRPRRPKARRARARGRATTKAAASALRARIATGGRDKKFGGDRKGGDRDKGERERPRVRRQGRPRQARRRPVAPAIRDHRAPSRDRDRPADPNSPFAKLAALKEQLARKD